MTRLGDHWYSSTINDEHRWSGFEFEGLFDKEANDYALYIIDYQAVKQQLNVFVSPMLFLPLTDSKCVHDNCSAVMMNVSYQRCIHH